MGKVLNSHYIDIVDKFEEKIYESISPGQKDEIGRNYKRVWELAGQYLDTSPIFMDYFPMVKVSHVAVDHLTRKIKQHKNDPEIPFKPQYLIKVLLFLGYTFPENTRREDKNTEEKQATLLYKMYKNRKEEKLNEEKNSEIGSTNSTIEQPKKESEIRFKKTIIEDDDNGVFARSKAVVIRLLNVDNEAIVKTVEEYYLAISKGMYAKVFDLDFITKIVSKNSENQEESYNKFLSTIPSIGEIENIHVFDITISIKNFNYIGYCKVYFDEIVNSKTMAHVNGVHLQHFQDRWLIQKITSIEF